MKKKLLLTAISITVFALLGIIIYGKNNSASRNEARLNDLTDRYLCEELSSSTLNLHYTLANPSSYGINNYKISYGSLSGPDLTHERVLSENYLAALAKIDRNALSENHRFTYDVLAYTLDQTQKSLDWYYYQEPLSPTLGIQAQLPILLAEYAFYRESDIADYLELLRQTEDYFQSILAFEQEKAKRGLFISDETLDNIVDQCIDFLNSTDDSYLEQLFNEKLTELSDISENQKKLYQAQHARILDTCFYPAYEQLVNGLMALKGSGTNTGGLCGLAEGKSYYAFLLEAITGVKRSPAETWDLLAEKRKEYALALQDLLSQNPELLSETAAAMTSEPAEMLSVLEQKIADEFPELPATSVSLKEVHPSLQQHSSPAFYLTPPIDRMEENTIYINPSDGYSGIDLFTTLAHEGFPGHLYQTVYSHTNCPNPLQSLISIGGYTEGWATYAEMYSYNLADLTPERADFLRLNKSWTLNLYCTIDIGVHYYGWTVYDICEFLSEYGIDQVSVCEDLYQAIMEDPGNYLRYYIGCLEFEALRERAKTSLGDNFDPKDFHRELLSWGPAPFSLLQDRIDAYIAQKD